MRRPMCSDSIQRTWVGLGMLFFGLAPSFGPQVVQAAGTGSAPPYQAGYRVLELPKTGGGAFPVAVWYPTDVQGAPYAYGSGKITGTATEGAPVKAGTWPLIILSHGFSGGGVGQATITERLSSYGFVVAAPDHSDAIMTVRIRGGETGTIQEALDYLSAHEPFDRAAYAYRPQELRQVLDAMLENPAFSIDHNRIILAGHSMGGWTAMTVALMDTRVRSLISYSMGELNWLKGQRFFEASELAQLRIPVLYLYGSLEADANPQGVYARYCFQHTPPPCQLAQIPSGNHFVYNERAIAPRSGGTPEQLEWIVDATLVFLGERNVTNTVGLTIDRSIRFQNLRRTYRLHVPPAAKQVHPSPLVLALHGGGGTGMGMEALTLRGFNRIADSEGILVTYPDGLWTVWNDGRNPADYGAPPELSQIDDVGFLRGLVEELDAEFGADENRIYATGISNGGEMCHRLALQAADRITAIAPVCSGLPLAWLRTVPPRPISVLTINGDADTRVLLDQPHAGKSSVHETTAYWVRAGQCRLPPATVLDPDLAPGDGTRVRHDSFSGGLGALEVVQYIVEGGGHTWPGGLQYLPESDIGKTSQDLVANDIIWSFFKRHPRDLDLNRSPTLTSQPQAAPNPSTVGEAVAFTVMASDPDGGALTCEWSFGDGATGLGTEVMHIYATSGLYSASVSVSDGKGGMVSAMLTVVVTQSVVLQDGLSGYAGTQDTCLKRSHSNCSFGKSKFLQSARDSSGDLTHAFLVRFAVFQSEGGPVPDGATIVSAMLSLYKYSAMDHPLQACRLQKNWGEEKASWNSAAAGAAWSVPGAQGLGADIAMEALGQASTGATDDWLNVEVTADMEAFSAGAANYGWNLVRAGEGAGAIKFCSRNYKSNPTRRPKLTVVYAAKP